MTASRTRGNLKANIACQDETVQIPLTVHADDARKLFKRVRPQLNQNEAAAQRFKQTTAIRSRRYEDHIAEIVFNPAQGRDAGIFDRV